MIDWQKVEGAGIPAEVDLLVTGWVENEPGGKRWYATATYYAEDKAFFDNEHGEKLYPPTHFVVVKEPSDG